MQLHRKTKHQLGIKSMSDYSECFELRSGFDLKKVKHHQEYCAMLPFLDNDPMEPYFQMDVLK